MLWLKIVDPRRALLAMLAALALAGCGARVADNTGAIGEAFTDLRQTPTSRLIDKHGAIVRRFVGAPDFAELHQLVDKLLAEA